MSDKQTTEEPNVTESAIETPQVDAPSSGVTADNAMDEDAVLDAILGDEPLAPTASIASVVGDNPSAGLSEKDSGGEPLDDDMLRALRRDGVPQTVIDQIGKDPDLLTEWATKAIKRQSDVDAYTEKMHSLEDTSAGEESPQDSDASEPTDADEKSVEGTTPLDALADELGEEAIEPLRQMQQELTDLRSQLDDANRRVVMSEVESAVEQALPTVLAKWGKVTDAQRANVVDRMSELGKAQPRTFNSIEELMRVAAKDVLGVPSVTKRSATPSPPRRVAKVERPATPEESEDAILDVLLGGGTVEEARQAAVR